MPIGARRVFRLSLTVSLTLAAAYGMAMPLPFISPIFALMFAIKPAPPIGIKGLLGVVILIATTSSVGLLLIPILHNYPFTALLIVGIGLFFSNYLSVNMGKAAVGAFLTVGLTLISAAGLPNFVAGLMVVHALIAAVGLAVLCQHVIYPFFPEDPLPSAKPSKAAQSPGNQSSWVAMRATLVVFPAYLMALTNPGMYIATIMKSVSLSQQSSIEGARHVGRELLGSTFAGGFFAILFWFALGISPTLWMFFLLMLLIGIYFSCKIYGLLGSRFPASYWTNVAITMFILLGPAVQDSANGKDVYKAFAIRMSLFVAVTIYAWVVIVVLDYLHSRRLAQIPQSLTPNEVT